MRSPAPSRVVKRTAPRDGGRPLRRDRKPRAVTTTARVILLAGTAFLLLSMGGGIIAAPATMPLLFMAARSSRSTGYRVAAGVVAALTAVELAWAITYIASGGGEPKPVIWLAPLLAGIAVGVIFVRFPARVNSR